MVYSPSTVVYDHVVYIHPSHDLPTHIKPRRAWSCSSVLIPCLYLYIVLIDLNL